MYFYNFFLIKDCGPVDTPLNGEVDLSDGTVYGSTATFSCHTGYYMNGTSQYNCTESGSWFPRTTAWPQCTLYGVCVIFCDIPVVIYSKHDIISFNLFLFIFSEMPWNWQKLFLSELCLSCHAKSHY